MASIHEGRLVVLLYSIGVIPAYFILFFMYITMDWTFAGQWAIIFLIFINPVTFIIIWEIFMAWFANRLANSYDRMKHIVSFVSIRYNLYYGVTTVFFVFTIVFPLVSPVISSLVLGSLVWRAATAHHDWEKDEKTPGWAVGIVVVVMAIPLICNVYFYINFIPQAWEFWKTVFVQQLALHLKNIAKAMATAVSLGSIAYLLRFGTSEYEYVFENKDERPKEIGYIRALQIFLFILFMILIYLGNKVFDYIQYLVIILNVILILGNLRKSRQISGVSRSVFSYIIITVLFIFSVMGQEVVEGIILIISSLLYIATFLIVFFTTPDDEVE
nr:hypothetical protein [Candidatus Sigynarchaeota archaeon]